MRRTKEARTAMFRLAEELDEKVGPGNAVMGHTPGNKWKALAVLIGEAKRRGYTEDEIRQAIRYGPPLVPEVTPGWATGEIRRVTL